MQNEVLMNMKIHEIQFALNRRYIEALYRGNLKKSRGVNE